MAAPEPSNPQCMAPDANPRIVFFEGRYSYRNWVVCLVVPVLFITGTWMFVSCAWQLVTGQFAAPLLGIVAVVAWLSLAWLPSIYFGWRILFRPHTHVRIDDSGITFGSRHWKWDDIDYIGGQQSRKWPKSVIVPIFHRRSRWPLKAINGIPAEMSDEQFAEFTERLAAYLENAYPHVTVG